MDPVVSGLPSEATWLQKVQECSSAGVDLTARGMSNPGPDRDGTKDYDIYACAVTEVEVDLLTGEKTVKRADVLNDVGYSISPCKLLLTTYMAKMFLSLNLLELPFQTLTLDRLRVPS